MKSPRAPQAAAGTMAGVDSGYVESVNVAVVRTDPWTRLKSGRTGIDKRPVDGPVRLDPSGVAGDTVCDVDHHGGPDQAVYAYARQDLDFWSAELGVCVGPGGVGENLTLSGVNCSGAVIGERWRIGDAVLVVRAPRIPCRIFAAFLDVPDLVTRFVAARRPGSYLAVDRGGDVRAGDAVALLDRPAHGVTVAEFLAALTGDRDLWPRMRLARDSMGAKGRAWVERTVGDG